VLSRGRARVHTRLVTGRKKLGAACLSRRDPFELAALTRQTPGLIEGRTRSTFGALHVLLPFNPLYAQLLPSLGVPKHSFQRGFLHGHLSSRHEHHRKPIRPTSASGGFSRRRSPARAEALRDGPHIRATLEFNVLRPL
jgi:hypothetical protein